MDSFGPIWSRNSLFNILSVTAQEEAPELHAFEKEHVNALKLSTMKRVKAHQTFACPSVPRLIVLDALISEISGFVRVQLSLEPYSENS